MPQYLVDRLRRLYRLMITEALLKRGDRVRGFDNFETGRSENLAAARSHGRFEFVEGDLRNAAAIAPRLYGCGLYLSRGSAAVRAALGQGPAHLAHSEY